MSAVKQKPRTGTVPEDGTSVLKTWPAPPDVKEVELTSDEVTVMCPKLGNPDFYTVRVRYRPRGRVVCTKALKEWFVSQRQEGYSCELFAQAIYRLLRETIDPVWLTVTVAQRARGGIGLTATCRGLGPSNPYERQA